MSDIQLYLLEVDKSKQAARDVAANSASKLLSKEIKLLDLISSLEPYINSQDDGATRAKSVGYLADLLESTQPRVLPGQERRLLCDFILGRLESDVEGIGASARGLRALEALGRWDATLAVKVAVTFLDHANPLRQFKAQSDRAAVIQLFDMLLAKYREAMKEAHENDSEFLNNLINLFSGEKDPRNLMITFSLMQVPMTEWDIQAHAQDLFESIFTYFPITFKPPPNDPYGITAQDLKDRLRACIAANSDFAPYSLPGLLDKLDSTSLNTKRDVLHALQSIVEGYDPNTINLYTVTLWDSLKFEILNVQEEDLAEASVKVLALIAAKFAESEGPLNAYLRPIVKESNEHLEDAPTKQSQAAGRILHALASSAVPVADKIVKGILPNLFTLYHASQSISKRRGLLEVFDEIIKAYILLTASLGHFDIEVLRTFASDALDAMTRALLSGPKAEVSFRLAALRGLGLLVALPKLLTDAETERAVDAVTQIVLHEQIEGHGDIRGDAIKGLSEIALSAPKAIRDRTIPAFMAEIPDVPADEAAFAPILEAFAQLSAEQQVFDTVLVRLKSKFNAARHQGASRDYQQALLLAILYCFTYGAPTLENDAVRSSYYAEYAEPLIALIKESSTDQPLDGRTLEIIGRISNTILRQQGVHFQGVVYSKNLEWMKAARDQNGLLAIAPFSAYYYAALRLDVIDSDDILELLKQLAKLAFAIADKEDATSDIVLRHISLLINKFVNPKAMRETLAPAGLEVSELLSADASPASINIAFAVVKALLVQGKSSALTTSYLSLLQSLLPEGSPLLAQRYSVLLAPDDLLTKANHCLVSPLTKQKTLSQTVPALRDGVRTFPAGPSRTNHLLALSGVIRWLPYDMLQSAVYSLLPALLLALDLTPAQAQNDTSVQESALEIVLNVLTHDSRLAEEHTASLITRLLACTSPPSSASMRAKSLQCLGLVAKSLKQEAVVPYRRQVVKKLLVALDDPKRMVRAEAVRSRKAWYGVDEVGEEEEDG